MNDDLDFEYDPYFDKYNADAANVGDNSEDLIKKLNEMTVSVSSCVAMMNREKNQNYAKR